MRKGPLSSCAEVLPVQNSLMGKHRMLNVLIVRKILTLIYLFHVNPQILKCVEEVLVAGLDCISVVFLSSLNSVIVDYYF